MTVLFGTVEYFEKEMINILNQRGLTNISREQILEIFSILEDEFRNEFVCAENLRRECLENLTKANMSFLEKTSTLFQKELTYK